MKSSHFLYNSDICRTTSVSAADDQTPDSYIAVYNVKNSTSLGGGKRLTPLSEVARPRRLVDVLSSHRSYFRCISDICRATFVSGVGDPSPDSYIAVSNANNTTSLVGGNASHAATGSRPTTSTSGVCCQLTGATSDVSATSVQLLPFPA